MNKYIAALLALIIFVVLGCGGGGGSASDPEPTPTTTKTITVPPGGTEAVMGEMEVNFTPDSVVGGDKVQLTRRAATPLPNGNIALSEELQIRPLDGAELNGQIVVSFPDTGPYAIGIVTTPSGAIAKQPTRSVGKIHVTIDAAAADAVSGEGGGSGIISWIAAKIGRLPNETFAPRWKHLAGSNDYNRPVVLVHGWMGRAQSMQTLANALVDGGVYGSVYAYEYDWRRPVSESAQGLAVELARIRSQQGSKVIDIIAHSRGGLVSRYALEIADATAAVQRLICINSPHKGAIVASIVSLAEQINTALLNVSFARDFAVGEDSLKEMMSGSHLLSTLNAVNGQTGRVDYYLIGSNADVVVDRWSATASGVDIEELTGGRVVRETSGGTHSSRINDPALVAQLVRDIAKFKELTDSSVELVLSPTIVDPYYDGRRWVHTLQIKNRSSSSIVVKDVMYELYDAYGAWAGTWWLPNTGWGGWFPDQYYELNQSIGSNDAWPYSPYQVNIYAGRDEPLISEAPANRRRQTLVATVRYSKSDGSQHTARATLRCRYNGELPSDAQTRAPTGGANKIPSPFRLN